MKRLLTNDVDTGGNGAATTSGDATGGDARSRFTDVPEENVDTRAYGVEGQAVRAGDRAPEAPALECIFAKEGLKIVSSLFDIFDPTKHIALVFHDGAAENMSEFLSALAKFPEGSLRTVLILPINAEHDASVNTKVDYVLRDTEGHAHNGYGIDASGTSVVIIRPDAYVGAFAISAGGVDKYRSFIFI